MRLAAARARSAGIPWVLDPVGAGATSYRTSVAAELVRLRPAVIRGNASEIMVVAGAVGAGGKGVDATHATEDALGPARRLARESGSVVAMTGAIDFVTDGVRTLAVHNGHPLMARVTGLGCTATALVGACLGAEPNVLDATVAALTALGITGEIAAEQAGGPGSLQMLLLDALHGLDEGTVRRRARIVEVP
jgi:hydroxyethylthiazole kinase